MTKWRSAYLSLIAWSNTRLFALGLLGVLGSGAAGFVSFLLAFKYGYAEIYSSMVFSVVPELAAMLLSVLLLRSRKLLRPSSTLLRPAGTHLLSLCRFLLPTATFERIVQDAVCDMRDAQSEALASGEVWRARWIVVRDQSRILLALAIEPISKAIFSLISPFIPKQ